MNSLVDQCEDEAENDVYTCESKCDGQVECFQSCIDKYEAQLQLCPCHIDCPSKHVNQTLEYQNIFVDGCPCTNCDNCWTCDADENDTILVLNTYDNFYKIMMIDLYGLNAHRYAI